jgi:uncharacterized protein with HEPN domain
MIWNMRGTAAASDPSAARQVWRSHRFQEDEVLQSAVLRWFDMLGEASRGLSEQFRHEHQAVPWREVFGLRNRVTHGYFDIDLDVVWNTIMNDLPALEDAIVHWLPSDVPDDHPPAGN